MYVLTAMDMMSIVQNIVLQCAKSKMIIVQNLIKNMTRYELLFFLNERARDCAYFIDIEGVKVVQTELVAKLQITISQLPSLNLWLLLLSTN